MRGWSRSPPHDTDLDHRDLIQELRVVTALKHPSRIIHLTASLLQSCFFAIPSLRPSSRSLFTTREFLSLDDTRVLSLYDMGALSLYGTGILSLYDTGVFSLYDAEFCPIMT